MTCVYAHRVAHPEETEPCRHDHPDDIRVTSMEHRNGRRLYYACMRCNERITKAQAKRAGVRA